MVKERKCTMGWRPASRVRATTVASLAVVLAFSLSSPAAAEKARALAVPAQLPLDALWEEPRDLASRDLMHGPWGAANAPDRNVIYDFVRPKRRATSRGVVVRDPSGRVWHVKQGREASPEVVVSRVLSAIGYHQPPVYFLPSFTLRSTKGITIADGGRFRLAKTELKARSEWPWDRNPFVGSRPYQGLLVTLVLLNSADLKTSNNRIYAVAHPQGAVSWQFVVRDLGTSLGETGRFDPPPNRVDVFEQQAFIKGVEDGFVAFHYGAVNSSLVHDRITPDDVHWACSLLARLSPRQWHDAFAGGGYAPDIADRFIRRIQEKIAEGLRVR
jgi:hypothetical protein